MKIHRHWVTAALLGSAGLFRQCKKNAGELIRIQTAVVFLKGVDILRDLFLLQIALQVCVVFLVFGIILMQGGLIFYLPVAAQMRVLLALIFGAADSLGALSLLIYFGSSKRWLRQAAKYNESVEDLMEGREWLRRNGAPRSRGASFSSRYSS